MTGPITLQDGVSYHIEQTPTGWLLVMQNAHCTLSQMFQSPESARQGVPTSASTLDSLTRQHLQRHPAP
jgi:hypothetical protein